MFDRVNLIADLGEEGNFWCGCCSMICFVVMYQNLYLVGVTNFDKLVTMIKKSFNIKHRKIEN